MERCRRITKFTEQNAPVNFEMVLIEGGHFLIGSEKGRSNELPIRELILPSFYMATKLVTQIFFEAVTGRNPSFNQGTFLPVVGVSWLDAQEFIQILNYRTGKKYRLPDEVEWEYACGGGCYISEKFSGTNSEQNLGDYAWYNLNSDNKTHSVGLKRSNSLGLYDMSGNVWEWCNDYYKIYSNDHATIEKKSQSICERVIRGGSIYFDNQHCRTSYRDWLYEENKRSDLGFRLAL